MIAADNRIKRWDLAILISGENRAQATDLLLKGYEAEGLVKPEIRREPLPPISPTFTMYSFRLVTRGDRPHDAFYESRRAQPARPVPAATLFDVSYYSPANAKSIAHHLRRIAPFRIEACKWIFGSDSDPEAAPIDSPIVLVTGSIEKETMGVPVTGSTGGRNIISKSEVVRRLRAECPSIESMLRNVGATQYGWLKPCMAGDGRRGWDIDMLYEVLQQKGHINLSGKGAPHADELVPSQLEDVWTRCASR